MAVKLNCSTHKYLMINKFHFAMVFSIYLIVVLSHEKLCSKRTKTKKLASAISAIVPVFHTVIQFSTLNENVKEKRPERRQPET